MPHPVTLLTIPETAHRLRCSKAHVYRLIATGQLPTVDIGVAGSSRPKTRVRETDLQSYLEQVITHP